MESQLQPKEYDAVLGGQSAIPTGAAVLGGVQGAIARLKHGDINTKKAALEYLEDKGANEISSPDVIQVVIDTLANWSSDISWYYFGDVAARVYANIALTRNERGLLSIVKGNPETTILYRMDDDNPLKYRVLLALPIAGETHFIGCFQSKIKLLLRVLDLENLKNVRLKLSSYPNCQPFYICKVGQPYQGQLSLLTELLQPLLLRLQHIDKYSLPQVKVYPDNIATFKVTRLFGVTWYATVSHNLRHTVLGTSIPSEEEVKSWVRNQETNRLLAEEVNSSTWS